MQNAQEMGRYAMECLRQIQQAHPCLGDVRGEGLMIGLDFVKDPHTREPDSALRDRVVDLAFEHGLLLLGCGPSVIRLAPPLCVTRSEVDEAFEILEYVIGVCEKGTYPVAA